MDSKVYGSKKVETKKQKMKTKQVITQIVAAIFICTSCIGQFSRDTSHYITRASDPPYSLKSDSGLTYLISNRTAVIYVDNKPIRINMDTIIGKYPFHIRENVDPTLTWIDGNLFFEVRPIVLLKDLSDWISYRTTIHPQ